MDRFSSGRSEYYCSIVKAGFWTPVAHQTAGLAWGKGKKEAVAPGHPPAWRGHPLGPASPMAVASHALSGFALAPKCTGSPMRLPGTRGVFPGLLCGVRGGLASSVPCPPVVHWPLLPHRDVLAPVPTPPTAPTASRRLLLLPSSLNIIRLPAPVTFPKLGPNVTFATLAVVKCTHLVAYSTVAMVCNHGHSEFWDVFIIPPRNPPTHLAATPVTPSPLHTPSPGQLIHNNKSSSNSNNDLHSVSSICLHVSHRWTQATGSLW